MHVNVREKEKRVRCNQNTQKVAVIRCCWCCCWCCFLGGGGVVFSTACMHACMQKKKEKTHRHLKMTFPRHRNGTVVIVGVVVVACSKASIAITRLPTSISTTTCRRCALPTTTTTTTTGSSGV